MFLSITKYLFIIIILLYTSVNAVPKLGTESDVYSLGLGKELGLSLGTTTEAISNENLQRILTGAKKGNKDKIYFLALLRLYGSSLSKNLKLAFENFGRAADLGHMDAMTAYAVMLTSDDFKDYPKAIIYFRKAISLKDPNAHWLLGKMLLEGMGVHNPQFYEAYELFKFAAQHHIPQAEHFLAVMYEYGLGIIKDFDKAKEYYNRAVEKQYTESMYHLALMYTDGRGGDIDYKHAMSLFEKCARENHAPCTYYVGVFLYYGYGLEPDYYKALNWFERAVAMDDFRINDEANHAFEELKSMLAYAESENNKVLERYQAMNDAF